MPYLRHRSFVFAPASPSFNTPMICSSVNRLDFMVRSHLGGLYSVTVLFAGSTSQDLEKAKFESHLRGAGVPRIAKSLANYFAGVFEILRDLEKFSRLVDS